MILWQSGKSMKNNSKLILDQINDAHYILIVTHKNPDADTISSALALSNFMYENKIKHKVYNSDKNIPRRLNFLPKFDKITPIVPKYYDLVIYVDCANTYRSDIVIEDDKKIINIDHHQSNDNFGFINVVDDKKASNAEVIFEFFQYNNIKISKNIATCLYVGIYDDSIAFTTPRTTKETFSKIQALADTGIDFSQISNDLTRRDSLARYRILPKILETLQLHNEGELATIYLDDIWLKETGATVNECDDVVDMALNIAIVKIVAYFRIIDGKVRVSLRGKGTYDLSDIASRFGGGGHKNAAGLTIDVASIKEAKTIFLEEVKLS